MSSCTEKTTLWPNTLASVPPEELDKFLEHAETCPYHAGVLRAEDDELRRTFSLARGLDSHGRVLQGEELRAAVAEHERRRELWNEAVAENELPFSRLSLYNNGKQIASCGKFFNLQQHDALHELEPHAGIQIRGTISGEGSEEVLLGFYPLAGVRHSGEERLLNLENGYTVGLKIHQEDETTFRVKFRCVEHEEIVSAPSEVRTKAAEMRKKKANPAGWGRSGSSPVPIWGQRTWGTKYAPLMVTAVLVFIIGVTLQFSLVQRKDTRHAQDILAAVGPDSEREITRLNPPPEPVQVNAPSSNDPSRAAFTAPAATLPRSDGTSRLQVRGRNITARRRSPPIAVSTINLALDASAVRGREKDTEPIRIHISRPAIRIHFTLPENSPSGPYNISFLGSYLDPLFTTNALSSNGKKMTVVLPTRLIPSGTYYIGVSPPGKAPVYCPVELIR